MVDDHSEGGRDAQQVDLVEAVWTRRQCSAARRTVAAAVRLTAHRTRTSAATALCCVNSMTCRANRCDWRVPITMAPRRRPLHTPLVDRVPVEPLRSRRDAQRAAVLPMLRVLNRDVAAVAICQMISHRRCDLLEQSCESRCWGIGRTEGHGAAGVRDHDDDRCPSRRRDMLLAVCVGRTFRCRDAGQIRHLTDSLQRVRDGLRHGG